MAGAFLFFMRLLKIMRAESMLFEVPFKKKLLDIWQIIVSPFLIASYWLPYDQCFFIRRLKSIPTLNLIIALPSEAESYNS